MRHKMSSGRKFSRPTGHRKAMLINLAKSLIKHEQIVTTLPKAKDLRPYVEKLLTKGKKNDLHVIRYLFSILRDDVLVSKIITSLSERYRNRPGGYTRVLHCGFRSGDRAPMAVIELVDRDISAKETAKKTTTESAAG